MDQNMEQNLEQNAASEAAGKQGDVQTAIEDIAIIKRMIDRSEINLRRLGWLFLSYGAVTLGFSMLSTVASVILSRFFTVEKFAIFSYIISGLSLLVTVCLFVFFMNMRGEMVRNESRYTMKLYDLWGIVLFVPVVLGLAPAVISIVGPYFGMSEYTPLVYRFVFNIMKYAAVCMGIFFTGHYIGSLFMKIVSLVLFILLPNICAFGTPFLDNFSIAEIGTVPEIYAYFSTKITFVSFIITIVYIVMGIVFLVKQRGQTDGDA